jgi:hypothetical protein
VSGDGSGLRNISPGTFTQALRDAIAWQREHRTMEDWPGQVSLYRNAGRELALDLGDVSAPAGPVTDPSGRQLDERDVATIRNSLAEAITAVNERLADWCTACMEAPSSVCGEHAGDTDRAAAFRDLAERLGGAR